MKRKQTRNQHYVTQAYLTRFSHRHGKGRQVFCFDKATRKVFVASVRNVAAERDFYNLDFDNDQMVEGLLGRCEDDFEGVCKKLVLAGDLRSVGEDGREALALFVALQQLRTREHRQHLLDLGKQMSKLLSDVGVADERVAASLMDEEAAKRAQVIACVTDVPKFAKILLNMKWILVLHDTPTPVWTSDHPVTLYNPVDAGLMGNLGLLCKGIQLFFPLSPSLVLTLCDPVSYADAPERITTADEQHVVFQNHLQVRSSNSYLFSSEGDFSFANRVLDVEPEYQNAERPRVVRDSPTARQSRSKQ